MDEYTFLNRELRRRYSYMAGRAVTISRLVVSAGYYADLRKRLSLDYPQFTSDAFYRWIVIGNQNPAWEILDLQIELQQPVADDTVTDVVFD